MEGSLAREYKSLISKLFQSTNALKPDNTGPTTAPILQVESAHPEKNKAAHFAALETAFRESFYHIIVRRLPSGEHE